MKDHEASRDVTEHFDPLGRRDKTRRDIDVSFAPNSYPLAARPKDDWLHFTQLAFKRLRHLMLNTAGGRRPVGSFWACGSSQGIDTINAWEILRPTGNLIVTDIMPDAVEASKENVLRNCAGRSNRNIVIARQGDLAEPLIREGYKVDLAYANLPTIPVQMTQQEIGARATWASTFYPSHRMDDAPEFARETLLQLYYDFLTQARQCLNPGGMVICAIGGRLLWNPIETLFRACGYSCTILAFDVKPQAQPELCFPAYRDLETAGRRFHYFPYPEAKEKLYGLVDRPWDNYLAKSSDEEVRDLHARALTMLTPMAISAAEATLRFNAGREAGHLVYVVAGEVLDHP